VLSTAGMAFRRALLPLALFLVVMTIHYLWLGVFPERDPAQDRWASIDAAESTWSARYIENQSYWLGFSYALPLAFAAVAIRRFREERSCRARNLAIGGITLTGCLAVAGCFLIGCCGSPMLAVYLSLFGAGFLPFAKPLVAVITAVTVFAAWWWMVRHKASPKACAVKKSSTSAVQCDCEGTDFEPQNAPSNSSPR